MTEPTDLNSVRAPKDWINGFLRVRGLTDADGRPLYQYQTTDTEFQSLLELLKMTTLFGLDHCVSMAKWDMAFVLFGAEWWRRCYEGHWAWEPLFNAFGASSEDIAYERLKRVAQDGLRQWRQSVTHRNGYNQYLGSMAVQGGLPVRVLEQPGTNLARLFRMLAQRYVKLQRSRDAADLAYELKGYLPAAFQNTQSYQILGGMVEQAVALRERHGLSGRADPLSYLDQLEPDWRNRFPLPMDADLGQALLRDLIDEAAKTEVSENRALRLRRWLAEGGQGWELKARLTLPNTFKETDFRPTDERTGDVALESIDMPARLSLDLEDDNGRLVQSLGRMERGRFQRENVYKPSTKGASLDGPDAGIGLWLVARDQELVFAFQWGPVSEALDDVLPWIFEADGETHEWLGQGSLKTRQASVWVRLPEDGLSPQLEKTETWEPVASTSGVGTLFELCGEVTYTLKEGGYCRIRTGGAQEGCLAFTWTGRRLHLDTDIPDVFLGSPQVLRADLEPVDGPARLALWLRPALSQQPFSSIGSDVQGVFDAQGRDKEGVVWTRRRIAVLPDGFDFRLAAGSNAGEGWLRLQGLGEAQALVEAPGCSVEPQPLGEVSAFNLKSETSVPPATFQLVLSWPGQAGELEVRLPFPAQGSQLLDPQQAVSRQQHLAIDALHGYRLRLFNPHPEREAQYELDFELRDGHSRRHRLSFSKRVRVRRNFEDLALTDYSDWLHQLAAATDNLEAEIRMSVYRGGTQIDQRQIALFRLALKPLPNSREVGLPETLSQTATLDELNGIEPVAVSLTQPEQTPIPLIPSVQEKIAGRWSMADVRFETDLWWILPSPESNVSFRPCLWVGDRVKPVSSDEVGGKLRRAIRLEDQTERLSLMTEILEAMALNEHHSGWHYVEELAGPTQHMRMEAFDLWRAVGHSPLALAGMIFMSPPERIRRLTSELPVLPEAIPFEVWLRVFKAFQTQQRERGLPEEAVNSITAIAVESLPERHTSLEAARHYLRDALGMERLTRLGGAPLKALLEYETQALLRRHADDQWPTDLLRALEPAVKELKERAYVMPQVPNPHQEAVMYLPQVLAAEVCGLLEWLDWTDTTVVFWVRQAVQFDEQWFERTFEYFCAYFLE